MTFAKTSLAVGFIIYGVQYVDIDVVEALLYCPSCEADNFADVLVRSKYFHLYFVPLFPLEKLASTSCLKCRLKRENLPFSPRFFRNYSEIKGRFRHPVFTYAFILFTAALILLALVFA